MQKRMLANLETSAMGLGCMGMTWAYGHVDRQQAINTIHHALDQGMNFLDTADAYGPHTNEELVGEAIKGRRQEVVLATKFGLTRGLEKNPGDKTVDGSPAYVKAACEASLKRLNTDHIDLYYLHRLDKQVPIEDTVGAMSELVSQGKVRHIGLSEVAANTIRKAHAVYPLTAIQSEYSLWTRDIESNGVLEALRDLNIGLVAYAPLGRGFLTGTIQSEADFAEDDYRRHSPRFQGKNLALNLEIVQKLQKLAEHYHTTAAQLALAWVLAQDPHIVPIFGTTKAKRIDENLKALSVTMTLAEIQEISDILPAAIGARYPENTINEIDN